MINVFIVGRRETIANLICNCEINYSLVFMVLHYAVDTENKVLNDLSRSHKICYALPNILEKK